jgi:uncharacterized protein
MTPQETKDMVIRTWQVFFDGDIKAAFANMSDDVTWLAPGNLPGLSGLHEGKDAIYKFMKNTVTHYPEGLTMEIRNAYCDGNVVIIELIDRGKVSNGRFYENDLCQIFEVENGKIRRIREYADTQKANAILFG